MRTRTSILVFALFAMGIAIAFSHDASGQAAIEDVVNESDEIALEDLLPDEQAAILDDLTQDLAEADGITSWADASEQLVMYAEFQIAAREAGVDLSVGVEP